MFISVNCQWGEWGDFTSCTKTCGEGRKIRYRVVYQEAMHGGDACLGNSTDIQTCKERDCPGTYSLKYFSPEISCKVTPHTVVNISTRSRFSRVYISLET